MGRAPCCDKANVKKGPWSPEEDCKLKEYIEKFGTGGNWIALPQKAGLRRCGKSCRLRWLNYLRPNIKHGEFSDEEDRIICTLFASIGSRWSIMAAHLPGRTDNDIKNYWNTKLKKKLLAMQLLSPSPPLLSSSSPSSGHLHIPSNPPLSSPLLPSSSLLYRDQNYDLMMSSYHDNNYYTTTLVDPTQYFPEAVRENYNNSSSFMFGSSSDQASCSSTTTTTTGSSDCREVKQEEEMGFHFQGSNNNNNDIMGGFASSWFDDHGGNGIPVSGCFGQTQVELLQNVHEQHEMEDDVKRFDIIGATPATTGYYGCSSSNFNNNHRSFFYGGGENKGSAATAAGADYQAAEKVMMYYY